MFEQLRFDFIENEIKEINQSLDNLKTKEEMKFMNNEIYIGDNLEVLKSKDFQKYKDTIKFIYIDPPYNTQGMKSYDDKVTSVEWKEFIFPRLLEAKKMLSNEGVIFISIDDNEYANLKLICDDIFGKENHLGTFITKQAQRSNAKHINTVHEYIIAYAKDKKNVPKFKIKRINIPEEKEMIERLEREAQSLLKKYGIEEANKKFRPIIREECSKNSITWLRNYNNIDEEGRIYFSVDLSTPSNPRKVSIKEIGLELKPLERRGWASDEKFIELSKLDRLVYKNGRPYSKKYLREASNNGQSILDFYSRQGTNDLKKLGIVDLFDTPKPVELIKYLIRLSTSKDEIILDFFAGSGTTAQAVYEINKEDNREHKYILVQIDEEVEESSKVYDKCLEKNINPNISDIMIYRINKYLEKHNEEDDYLILNKKTWR